MQIKTILPWFLTIFFFTHFHGFSHAQIAPNISLRTAITAGSNVTWQSPSGEFAFGFYLLPNNLYVVGIWLEKIQDKTLLWSANRDSPDENGAEIRLTANGQLLLTYTNNTLQKLHTGAAASLAFMQNDGNFVLKDSNSNLVWQSFNSPTDTIIPGQILVAGQELYSNSKGIVDRSTGNFKLAMQYDGNLVLSTYRFSDPGYWYTKLWGNNVSLVFDKETAFIYLVNNTGDEIQPYNKNVLNPVEDYYYRATIDDQGNFQQYAYNKNNGTGWVRVWRAINESCTVNSVCGVYGLCSSTDNETMTCSCLPGYIPLDPNHLSKGCHPEIVLNYCANPNLTEFTMVVMEDTDFLCENFADLARVRNVDLEGCKKAVMDDCYAFAASFVDSRCIKKRRPLLNVRKTGSTKGIHSIIKVPIKSANTEIPGTKHEKNSNTRGILEAGVISSATLAIVFAIVAIYCCPGARKLLVRKSKFSDANSIGINFRIFTFQELRDATNDFSNVLGQGSSGKVYRGILKLKDTEIEIAVKKLEVILEKGEGEFITELQIIGRTHHKNLVRLLGFCTKDNHQILVYELMKNGTLSDYIFGQRNTSSWDLRAEMALGIARGLMYLHEECETQIIHCDMKPQNVLLDTNYSARISDFGLSKLLNKDQTRTHTRARGTVGYIAPEWLRNAPVTTKVDIYSFGVMLLEIICNRRHIDMDRVEEETEEDDLVLSDWVMTSILSGQLETVIEHDQEVLVDFPRFEKMAMVGLWCINPDPFLRPSIKKVMQMLEGTTDIGIPPLLYDHMSKDRVY